MGLKLTCYAGHVDCSWMRRPQGPGGFVTANWTYKRASLIPAFARRCPESCLYSLQMPGRQCAYIKKNGMLWLDSTPSLAADWDRLERER